MTQQPTGEKSHNAKLRKDQVNEIRQRYAKGGVSQLHLAVEYGVGPTQIGRIVRGERWKQ